MMNVPIHPPPRRFFLLNSSLILHSGFFILHFHHRASSFGQKRLLFLRTQINTLYSTRCLNTCRCETSWTLDTIGHVPARACPFDIHGAGRRQPPAPDRDRHKDRTARPAAVERRSALDATNSAVRVHSPPERRRTIPT